MIPHSLYTTVIFFLHVQPKYVTILCTTIGHYIISLYYIMLWIFMDCFFKQICSSFTTRADMFNPSTASTGV